MEYAFIAHFGRNVMTCNQVVDCAEGTLRQFALQPYGQRHLKVHKLAKIFITHMHGVAIFIVFTKIILLNPRSADHVMGIVTILRSLLYPPRPSANTDIVPKKPVLVIHVRLETIFADKVSPANSRTLWACRP
jgi:hypothetical protein